MKKKRFLYVLVAAIVIFVIVNFIPKKPFSELKKSDVKTAELMYGDKFTVSLEEAELNSLIEYLNGIEVSSIILDFNQQGDTRIANGMFNLEMNDGKEINISCIPTRMSINNISFVCSSDENGKIMELYNSVISRSGESVITE